MYIIYAVCLIQTLPTAVSTPKCLDLDSVWCFRVNKLCRYQDEAVEELLRIFNAHVRIEKIVCGVNEARVFDERRLDKCVQSANLAQHGVCPSFANANIALNDFCEKHHSVDFRNRVNRVKPVIRKDARVRAKQFVQILCGVVNAEVDLVNKNVLCLVFDLVEIQHPRIVHALVKFAQNPSSSKKRAQVRSNARFLTRVTSPRRLNFASNICTAHSCALWLGGNSCRFSLHFELCPAKVAGCWRDCGWYG